MKYIDLTHTIKNAMLVFSGDPIPKINQIAFTDNDGYNGFRILTGMHAGTHIDAPFHMLSSGKRLSEYPVEYFFGKGILIDARGNKQIDQELLKGIKLNRGDIVIVLTGFFKKFGQQEYYDAYPEITKSFAEQIIKYGIKMIGMDTPGPDREPYVVHKLLLNKDILIIENLTNLEKLSENLQFNIIALPIKLDTEAAPARVVAQIL